MCGFVNAGLKRFNIQHFSLPGVFLDGVDGRGSLQAAFRRQRRPRLAVGRFHHRGAVLQGAVGVRHVGIRAVQVPAPAASAGGVARPHRGIVVGAAAVVSRARAVAACALQRGGVDTGGGGSYGGKVGTEDIT